MQSILERIKDIVETINPDYKFIFETDRLMNVRADDKEFPIAFWEEYTEGAISYDAYGRGRERVRCELSFMRLAPRDTFQPDAIEREAIRQTIKEEIVYDFCNAIATGDEFIQQTDFEVMAEPPRFDATVVSVLVRFNLERYICIESEDTPSESSTSQGEDSLTETELP